MADEKPASKADAPQKDTFVEIVWMLLALLLVVYLINGVYTTIVNSRIFSGGFKGLTPQGMLLLNTRPIASLYNPINAPVMSINVTDVLNAPGGRKIGTHKISDRGVILQGPVDIDGVRYWYVDYAKDPDGWVRETNIAYIQSEPNILQRLVIFIYDIIWLLKIIAIIVFVVCVVGIIYLIRKINRYYENEHKLLYPEVNKPAIDLNPQWEGILEHVDSTSENDWRLAIMEADIMLDDLLAKLNLPGETIGDRLKAVGKGDFHTIDNAWEAHKVRNQIAHEGQAFRISQREAKRVIDLYKTVFEEHRVI